MAASTPATAGASGSQPEAPLVAIEGLDVSFDTAEGGVPAVRGLDLTLRAGEILGLVGESGSGKSVTCQALLGLLPDNARLAGRLRFDGRSVAPDDRRALAGLRGQHLSMVFQDPMSASTR